MSDDRKFDRLVEEELSALPPPETVLEEVTPWRRAMKRIVWGIGLSTITLNILYLNVILPAFGYPMLVLGFRALRRENRWFHTAWLCSMLQLGLFALVAVGGAAILWPEWLGIPMTAVNLLAGAVRLICLWRGIISVRLAAGQEGRATAAGALVWFYLVMIAAGLVKLSGLLLVVPLLVIYICILVSLSKVAHLLDGAGYQVSSAPVRLSDLKMKALWAAGLMGGILLVGALFSSYPMDWSPRPADEQAGLEDIRAHLLELGMEELVVDALAPEDLKALEGAVNVSTEVSWERLQWERPAWELRMSNVAVRMPDDRWQIIHFFLWEEEPPIPGSTESIQIWPAYRHSDYWREGEDHGFSGRVLYDKDGTTYVAPYYALAEEGYQVHSFFGSSYERDIFAAFSRPRDGERCRGYVRYSTERIVKETVRLSSWMNYTHQDRWLNYPAMTAVKFRKAGILGAYDVYQTYQSAVQFYPDYDERRKYDLNEGEYFEHDKR